MRTTVDIPDPIYRQIKQEAASEGRTVKEIILRRVAPASQECACAQGPIQFPAIKAKKPGSLKLGPEGVYEYIPFP